MLLPAGEESSTEDEAERDQHHGKEKAAAFQPAVPGKGNDHNREVSCGRIWSLILYPGFRALGGIINLEGTHPVVGLCSDNNARDLVLQGWWKNG